LVFFYNKFMNYDVEINGIEVKAYYSQENINEIFLPLLHRLVDLQTKKAKRILVMLAAPPGAGKSTLCSFLQYLAKINNLKPMNIIGMDGFHHYQDYLLAHDVIRDGKKVNMVDIKGAPITFDLPLLEERIAKVAKGENCGWPIYNRMLHNPQDNVIQVDKDIVILEGNYLLLKDEGWNKLSDYADYTIRIDANIDDLRKRLIERKFASNKDLEKATIFVDSSDLVNAKICLENCKDADLIIHLKKDDTYEQQTN